MLKRYLPLVLLTSVLFAPEPAPPNLPVVIDDTAPPHPVLVLSGGRASRVETLAVEAQPGPAAESTVTAGTGVRVRAAARGYARGIAAGFRSVADLVRRGELADIDATVEALGKARHAAGAGLGTELDAVLRPLADEHGAYQDRAGAASVLSAVATALEGPAR